MSNTTAHHKPDDLSTLPRCPGCYIFRDRHGQIIYIGKSKMLCNRVRQYFNLPQPVFVSKNTPGSRAAYNRNDYNKYAGLAREIADIETVTTDTETNALILECKLIKQHKPMYNSQLKHTSDYHYICVDTERAFPVITVTGGVKDGGCRYFGGFQDKYDAENTVELINSIWKTPLCGRASTKPCLNFHIGKCCAPCGGTVDAEDYRAKISEIVECLSGRGKGTLKRLTREMKEAAAALDFEKAAALREKTAGLARLMNKQKRLYTDLRGKDVFLFLRAFNEQIYSLFFIRDGAVINRADFPSLEAPGEDALADFLRVDSLPVDSLPGDSPLEETAAEEGRFLTVCLLEIGASKLFIPVGRKDGIAVRLKKLRSGFKEFLS